MPELPEVETLCRQLNAKITGMKIHKADVIDRKLAGMDSVMGTRVQAVRRSGKTIVMVLDDGRAIEVHLRMTGRLLWNTSKTKFPHSRWRLRFGEGFLDLVDPRRFATVNVGSIQPDEGTTDLLVAFDERNFQARQAKRKVSVKTLLMDSKAIAGIGNIYACEILHRAGVSPLRKAEALTESEWKKVFRLARRILKKGIENRGTSVSDWCDLYGCKGENQRELRVYGKEGKMCGGCGGTIKRIRQGQRSTFYCTRCQK